MDDARLPAARPGLSSLLRALRHRNYRLFFVGQGISLVGTWLSRAATSWLVYRLTDSAFLLGVLGFAGQIPMFFLAPLGGALVDRWDRRRILIATQALSMLQSFTLAVLALSQVITVTHIVILSVFQGLLNALDVPARQSYVIDLVEGNEDLPNAIALNSSMFNAARLVGPAIGGILIASVGEGYCFLIDGFSYLAVVASLLAIHVRPPVGRAKSPAVLRGIQEGISYAFGFAPIRAMLALIAVISLLGMPHAVLMPVFARDVLGGGPSTLGFLMAASGVGALLGAFYLASRKTVRGLGRLIAAMGALSGVSLAAFSQSRAVWLSLPLMALVGFGILVLTASSNTVLQTIVEDDKRGRVMSLYAVAFLGVTPVGSLLAGALANAIGAPITVLLGGVGCLVSAAAFFRQIPALREQVLPIYVEKGIVPEVATAIQTATALTELPKK
ncbi:MAG TPA: MFS transporter [Vicinamibacteria bacterium]|nr:MFS transporter [Vicinamibacteria bacterium]